MITNASANEKSAIESETNSALMLEWGMLYGIFMPGNKIDWLAQGTSLEVNILARNRYYPYFIAEILTGGAWASGRAVDKNFDQKHLLIHAQVYKDFGTFRPYIYLGGGGAVLTIDDRTVSQVRTNLASVVDIGIGTAIALSRELRLRCEYRYSFIFEKGCTSEASQVTVGFLKGL